MQIAVYSPYLDTYGGGERYILSIAEILSKHHHVSVLLDTNLQKQDVEALKKTVTERMEIDLERVDFIPSPLGVLSKSLDRFFFLKQFDVLFAVTDGSIFYSSTKKSILHIQSPIPVKPAETLQGRIKLSSWSSIIYNSQFTKESCQQNWPLRSSVVYPPVDTQQFMPLQKKKMILTVGRFFGFLKEKKQKVLIEVFIELYRSGKIDGWELHLAGSASDGDSSYLQELKSTAQDAPVFFHTNIPFNKLTTLYGEAAIYWHAMGFKEEDPTKHEHFGITTVEAMASGCVPIVVKKGGQVEIVEENKSGLFWESEQELMQATISLISDESKRSAMSQEAIKRSAEFSKAKFEEKILSLINA